MFTKILKPEIMRTLLPQGFPADKLSQPQHAMVTETDVFITMRDGARVAVDIFRPDAPGEYPVIYATSAYQKDLAYLPQVPAFHFRETNDIEWFVSRGYVYVHQDIRGSGKSVDGEWQFFSREEQNDFYDVIEWAAGQSWSQRQRRHDRRVVPGLGAVVRRGPAAAPPQVHRSLRRRRRHVPRRGLPRRHHVGRLSHRLAHVGDPRELPAGPARPRPRPGSLGPALARHQPPRLRRLLAGSARRLRQDPLPRALHRHAAQGRHSPARQHPRLRGADDAQEAGALPRRLRGRRDGHLQLGRDAPAAAALVRPLAQRQRHRPHGRRPGDRVRARQRGLPPREGVAAAAHASTASSISPPGPAAAWSR